jgi:hypothetical protein
LKIYASGEGGWPFERPSLFWGPIRPPRPQKGNCSERSALEISGQGLGEVVLDSVVQERRGTAAAVEGKQRRGRDDHEQSGCDDAEENAVHRFQ